MIITDPEPKTPTGPLPSHMESTGFPPGYFVIRSVATGKLLDVRGGQTADGTEIILFPGTDNSLVDS
jgi:DDB1- and CUL4-associated factor 11